MLQQVPVVVLTVAFMLLLCPCAGVAAAEGLALGGWSVSSARASKASSAAAAAELARARNAAGRELAALRALLQQREAAYGQEVGRGRTWRVAMLGKTYIYICRSTNTVSLFAWSNHCSVHWAVRVCLC